MGQGGQSRGLIIAAQTAGYDPTRIYDTRTGKSESIANFDKDPKDGRTTGRLPADVPDQRVLGHTGADTWHTNYQNINPALTTHPAPNPVLREHGFYMQEVDAPVSWNTPRKGGH